MIIKAEITIQIPRNIVERLKECECTPEEILKIFTAFMKDLMEQPYGQFYNDFDNWLEGMSEEEVRNLCK